MRRSPTSRMLAGPARARRRTGRLARLRRRCSRVRRPAASPARTRSDEPALCFYTSGTTKDPKAVLHAHAYTFAHRYTGEYWLDLQRTDLHWTTADTGWAKAAYGVLFGPWMNGVAASSCTTAASIPSASSTCSSATRCSVFCAPPTEYRLLVKQDLARWRLPRLRHCVGAGEPLNPEVIHAWHDALGLLVHDGYGQTESIILAANLPALPIRPGSMGKPFPGHDLRVIGDDGAELPAGEVGDLALRGHPPSLFLEYWKSPEETAACRRGEWYLTGDRAQPRRGRLPLVRRPRRRRHHLGRLPHRSVRGGERAPRAPGGGRVGGGREPRPRPRRDREGVRGAARRRRRRARSWCARCRST